MSTCKNGDQREVKHPRTQECGTCYQTRYYRERRSPNADGTAVPTYPLATVGYAAAHYRVRAAKGKASQYPCAEDPTHMAEEWAYKGTSDQEQTGFLPYKGRKGQSAVTQVSWSPNPDDYRPLCRMHHGLERCKWGVPNV